MRKGIIIATLVLFSIISFGCGKGEKVSPQGPEDQENRLEEGEKVPNGPINPRPKVATPEDKHLAIYKAYEEVLYSPGNPYDAQIPETGDIREWAETYNQRTSQWEQAKAEEIAKEFNITPEEVKQITYWVRDYLNQR